MVKLYALSTCPYCRMTRKFLDDEGVEYEEVEVDKLEGAEREDAVEEVRRVSGGTSFPVVVAGEEVIVGFDKARIKKTLGI
ncbi:MAG: glutaredoxin family protein [Coriobacteriia bacterium]|nr:glutaredoxin family protein [Coriobacteriia bacterium]